MFGGILHVFRVPLSGALLSGFAAILISLLSLFSVSRGEILKAAIIVIVIKASISPYTPLTAYFAVFLQGCLGELFFYSRKFFEISSFLFAIAIVLLAGAQRILILTILFGNSFWNSIDVYSKILVSQFFSNAQSNNMVSVSMIIISAYMFLHLIIGVTIGIISGRLPEWIDKNISDIERLKPVLSSIKKEVPDIKKNKKRWWNKTSGKIFLIVVLILVIYSYLHPELGKDYALDLIIMLLRSFLILFLWFTLLSPLLYKVFQKFISKKQNSYLVETNKIISSFPELKKIAFLSWTESNNFKGIKRLKCFLTSIALLALLIRSDKLA